MAESSECIILILGHSDYNTRTPDYKTMPPGKEILTLLPADIGFDCFADKSHVISILADIKKGWFHEANHHIY